MVKIQNWIINYIAKHPDFEVELRDMLTDDCPYFETCGEAFFEMYGSDYNDARQDRD